jgi:hypothetical protein
MPETTKQPKGKPKANDPVNGPSTDGSTIGQPPVQDPPKQKTGRPTDYNLKLASEICTRISNGEALRQICMREDMPNQSSVYLWLARHPEFSEMYTRAREEQADTLADEIQAIADETPETNPIYSKTGELIKIEMHSAYIQWQKNRIDARKWVAAKLKPRKYGDRVELTGDKDNPLHINAQVETKTLFSTILQNLELKKQAQE